MNWKLAELPSWEDCSQWQGVQLGTSQQEWAPGVGPGSVLFDIFIYHLHTRTESTLSKVTQDLRKQLMHQRVVQAPRGILTLWRKGVVGISWSSAKGRAESCCWWVIIPCPCRDCVENNFAEKDLGVLVDTSLTLGQQCDFVLGKLIQVLWSAFRKAMSAVWGRWSFTSVQTWWVTSGVLHLHLGFPVKKERSARPGASPGMGHKNY